MNTIMETIQKTTAISFENNGLNIDEFAHDITSFNSSQTRAMAIYDDCQLERIFVLVGFQRVGSIWKAVYFKNSAETAGAGHYDGLDAMCDAETFLKNDE